MFRSTVRSIAPLAAALVLAPLLSAQVRQPGQPASDWAGLSSEIPTFVMPAQDIAGMKAEDEANNHWPLRYGAVIPTDVDIAEHGRWDTVAADGSFVWRARITSPGAYSLGLTFGDYALPAGAQVFVYNGDKSDVLGAYTDFNNKEDGTLGVQPVQGDTLVIEYVQQSWVTDTPRLALLNVIHDYRDILDPKFWDYVPATTSSGRAPLDPCAVDINCPAGTPYQTIKRSAIRTLAGGALCSGAILNNTAQDGTPYMLTAEHCGLMTSGVFLFNYENSTCGGGGASLSNTIAGATRRATSVGLGPGYDSQLYQLTVSIPTGYNPYFAGWDRSTVSGSPATHIGHGGGCPKQICIDNNGASRSGSAWNTFWNTGMLVGGSSGGPLYNGSQRVIGPACCVSAFNCGTQTASFGRFDGFWNSGNLAQWLDPTGTGTTFIDGFDPGGGPGGSLSITSVTPTAIPALMPGTSKDVTIKGTGFSGTTTVTVDGQSLGGFPSPVQFVSSTQIDIDFPQLNRTGLITIQLDDGIQTALTLVSVVPPVTPVLQMGPGDEPVTTFFSVDLTVSSQPNDLFFVYFSDSPAASSLPGVVNFTIGQNFTRLWDLGFWAVSGSQAWTKVNIPYSGVPSLSNWYFEGIALNAGSAFPLTVSNRQWVQVII